MGHVAMKKAVETARRAAKSDLPILLTGESGVGKGALAKLIHESGPRATAPFLQLNCAALPVSIAEAELFGVKRGAYTDARENRGGVFEQAHQGTLVLDEIGELPLDVQPKLLSALDSGRVRPLGATSDVTCNTRIVAATNRPLEEALRERRFRADLYHRLNVVRIEVPPLRERIEDIDAIVDQVLARAGKRTERAPIGISTEVLRLFKSYSWPGNVRELVNAVERAIALTDHDVLVREDFSFDTGDAMRGVLSEAVDGSLSLEALERRYIQQVLAKTGGHKANAAKILGLDRRTLYRKVAEIEGRTSDGNDA